MLLLFTILATVVAGPFDHLWTSTGHANHEDVHPITFFVKEKASFIAGCGAMLEDISTPGSANYGNQYKFEDMKQFADEENFEAVRQFAIKQFGADRVEVSPNMDMVSIPDATVKEVERAFHLKLHTFVHTEDKTITLRRPHRDLKLPKSLRHAVHAVSGLSPLPHYRAEQLPMVTTWDAKSVVDANGFATPQLLWSYYGVNNRTVASSKSKNSLFAALGQSFSPSDLSAWQKQFSIKSTPIKKVIGPNNGESCAFNPNGCVEASLDVQQATSTAQSGDTTFHSIGSDIQDIFLDWIQAVNKEANPPLVNSVSYGSLAPEDPKYDIEHFSTAACKAGLRGITIIVASGDDGVANFAARQNPSACGFTPSYPATVPYVTAVGATQGPEAGGPEIVCSSSTGGLITSGGGFSDLFPTPSWQLSTVQSYLNKQQTAGTLPPVNMFSRHNRAYPDIAVMGHNYQVEVGGQLASGVSGTSASAPVFSAMITLINGIRLANGKNPIGFLNPTLYAMGNSANPSDFYHGVSSGKNNCCAGQEGAQVCCQYGFSADPNGGWSPTVGWGSPKFQAFSKHLINMP